MPTRYKTPKGVRWRGVIKIDGRVVETKMFGTGPQGKRAAAQWELEKRKELRNRQILLDSPNVLKWSNRYCEFSKQNHTLKTFKYKVVTFKRFLAFLKTDDLAVITPALAMEYLQMQCQTRSGYAANKDRKELATAWKWGERYLEGFPRTLNPFWAVDKFKEKRSPRYIPEERDFWEVVDVAAGQDRCILLALFYLGARRGKFSGSNGKMLISLKTRFALEPARPVTAVCGLTGCRWPGN